MPSFIVVSFVAFAFGFVGIIFMFVATNAEIKKLPERIAEKMIEKLLEEEKRKQESEPRP